LLRPALCAEEAGRETADRPIAVELGSIVSGIDC
jgi:hypothetical protein